MLEPSLRTSRLTIAGGFVAAIAFAGAGFLLGRTTSHQAEQVPPPPSPPVIAPQPQKVEAPPILRRADIIALGNRAADAFTGGNELPAEVGMAAGRRFEIVIPFGCDGPAAQDSSAPLSWRYDAEKQSLRIHAAPTRWQLSEWGLGGNATGEAALEGFWVSRPWSSVEQCPQQRGHAAALNGQSVILPGQTLALADQLSQDRVGKDRSYDTVQRVAPDRVSAAQGFRLRLKGRIERKSDGQPVRCIQPAGIEQRPICLITVSFEEVRIENPLNDEVLATWSVRSPARNTP